MKKTFDRKEIERVAELVAELKGIIGNGIEEYRGIMTVDVGFFDGFSPSVLVDNELLENNFDNIVNDGKGGNSVIVNGVKFHSIGN